MRTAFLGMALCLVASLSLAAPEAGESPTVEIAHPIGGWSTERIVEVQGSISDEGVARAVLVVNGFERWIDVKGGKFSATLVVSKGNNNIEVVARNAAGEGRDRVSFFSDVPAVDLQVVLSWDTDGTDVDLHVTDPSGEECYYGHRETKLGGKLDVDDTDGYGPEVFTLANAATGQYRVRVKYYSSHDHPQTACRIQVVQYEGTGRERRLEFFKILTKTGDAEEVGTFELAAPQQVEDDAPGPPAGTAP